MMRRLFQLPIILAVLIAAMILIAFLALAIKTATAIGFPDSNTLSTPSTASTLSTEALCARLLTSSGDLPPEKRVAREESYQKCLEARKVVATQYPDINPLMRLKTITPVIIYPSPDPGRRAGVGKIVESSGPSLPSYLIAENEWWLEENGKLLGVYAITQRGDGVGELPKPWQGMVWVEVMTLDKSKHFSNEEGIYQLPVKAGRMKIVDAQGQRLVLRAENGMTFYFDVPARRFVSSLTEIVPTATPASKPVVPPYP